ncbi:MAG: diaminopimelate epimerase [Bacteroidota bacterium]
MPNLVAPFTKMNGAGNDFVVLDNRFLFFSDDELVALAQRYCPRRTGVGADGLLALNAPDEEGADYHMRYVNADGSWARMCGNGARCLARFARSAGIGEGEGTATLTFDSDAGRYTAAVPERVDAAVRLHVPPPRDYGPRTLADGTEVVYVWTGTDHAIVFVDDLDAVDVVTRGAAIRRDPAFAPAGANANFVEVSEKTARAKVGNVRVRTFEKGVEGETLACGTGALAAAVASHLTRRVQATWINVVMPGGKLQVTFQRGGTSEHSGIQDLTLSGPAETVYQGTLDVDVPTLTAA